MVSDGEMKPVQEKEPQIPQSLDKELNVVLSKENDWSKYKTEKLDVCGHDSLKKFKSELLDDNKTVDVNQLKLDLNLGSFLINKNPSHSQHSSSMKDNKKEPQTIKSASNHNSHASAQINQNNVK